LGPYEKFAWSGCLPFLPPLYLATLKKGKFTPTLTRSHSSDFIRPVLLDDKVCYRLRTHRPVEGPPAHVQDVRHTLAGFSLVDQRSIVVNLLGG
jgi:hypothetical protein